LPCKAPSTSSDVLLCTLVSAAAAAAAAAAALALLLDPARSPFAAACGQTPLLLALLPADLQVRRPHDTGTPRQQVDKRSELTAHGDCAADLTARCWDCLHVCVHGNTCSSCFVEDCSHRPLTVSSTLR
jgi:hypothetical protein